MAAEPVASAAAPDWLDATELAAMVRRGDASPMELVDAAIERIECLNPRVNAVVTPLFEEARRMAQSKLPDGPFSGVPFLLKDSSAACAGTRMTSGARLLQKRWSDRDSELVARLRRAGLVVIGKTNCAELGLLPTTEPALFGPTRNPWNVACTAGGSSGGSAAAVAAGMVPMAHASDGGGSLRIPASCCGLFGLKPSRWRNPPGADWGDMQLRLVAEHALTRSVRDSAALLDATQGPEAVEAGGLPDPRRRYADEILEPPGRLRIAFAAETLAPVHRDCETALHDAVLLCQGLGHELVEARPRIRFEEAARHFLVLWSAGCAATLDDIAKVTGKSISPEDVEPLTWALYARGRATSASDYQLSLAALRAIARDAGRFFTDFDVWLTPVASQPPPMLGHFQAPPDDPFEAFRRAWAYAPIAALANITGQPAMSVPLWWNAQGLPVGSHFAGRLGDEATLFRLAAQLEAARPWAKRRPGL